MNKNYKNTSIKCNVDQCKYHCENDDYCALKEILVGNHAEVPEEDQCTDCQSYEIK